MNVNHLGAGAARTQAHALSRGAELRRGRNSQTLPGLLAPSSVPGRIVSGPDLSFETDAEVWVFSREYDRQLIALPHHLQAMVLIFPAGHDARQLALRTQQALER